MGIVRENINFERGLDPKEALGLGYKSIHTHEQMQKAFPKAIEERSSWQKGSLYNLGNGLYAETKYRIISVEGTGPQGTTGPQGVVRTRGPLRSGVQGTSSSITYSSDFDIVKVFSGDNIIWKNPIFENINFERGMEPKQSMNIGKIKLIQDWMDEVYIGIKNFLINDKFEIDTPIDIILQERPEMFPDGKLPEYIRFNSSGSFDVDDSGINSLEGFPRVVQGYFSCQQNQITSLEGFPIKIDKSCYVMSNGIDFTADEIKDVCEVGEDIEADDSDV